MKGIGDVEKRTGISRQNIRYYEKEGLLKPGRNPENSYRRYGDEDVKRLFQIKLLRKLGMPIGEIRRVLEGEVTLGTALAAHQSALKEERKQLKDAADFCGRIQASCLEELQAEEYLAQMELEETRGALFDDFVRDFKQVARDEGTRYFTFMPDTMCLNPREFTDALFAFGEKEGRELVVTKEGMYPEFTLDGVEYEAHRVFSRYGAVVHCVRKWEKLEEIPEKRRRGLRLLYRLIGPAAVLLFVVVIHSRNPEGILWVLLPVLVLIAAWLGGRYFDQFKG